MLNQEEYMEIKILHKQGLSMRKIAKQLDLSRNTVRRYLRHARATGYRRKKKLPLKLDAYKSYILTRIQAAYPIKIPASVLFREICEQGYKGKIRILNYLVHDLYQALHPEEPILRFETPPGCQMQVDWSIMQGGKDRLLAFAGILGYSRSAYVEFTFSEDLETLLKCHENTFDYFGGVPREILYDNMKTVVIQRDRYGKGKHGFQPGFWDFAKHCGFLPRLCRPYRAKTKGKVERFIRYLKESFYNPYITKKPKDLMIDLYELNDEVKRWLKTVADIRIIRELCASPLQRLQDDRQALQALAPAYQVLQSREQNHLWVEIQQHGLEIYDALRGCV